jgi:ABC-2 type transport system ATP-binding protein
VGLLPFPASAISPGGDEALSVTGLSAARVGELAMAWGIVLHGLATRSASLEQAFMELTADRMDYVAGERR